VQGVPVIDDGDLAALCAQLADEPLWHASLGSKELFHSNMLAWALERSDPEGRRRLLPGLAESERHGEDRVLREFRHLDLVVELDGHDPVVIENKTFSLPDEAQLARYASEAISKLPGTPTLLLLSLIDPGWDGGRLTAGGRDWTWLPYPEVGARLAAEFSAGSRHFPDVVLAHQGQLMTLLATILELVAVQGADEPLELPQSVLTVLDTAHLTGPVRKARAYQLGQLIRQRLQDDQVREPGWPLEVGFSNGQPLVASFWQASEDLYAGWQLQGGQWRLALILRSPQLFGRGRLDERFEFARRHLDYFDFTGLSKGLGVDEETLLPRRNARSRDFNSYEPDFVYQYRRLPSGATIGQLIELASLHSEHAATWHHSDTDAP
jgi:hypothetical protein